MQDKIRRHPIFEKFLAFFHIGRKSGEFSEKQIEEIATEIAIPESSEAEKLQRLNEDISKLDAREQKNPEKKQPDFQKTKEPKDWQKPSSDKYKSKKEQVSSVPAPSVVQKKPRIHHRIVRRIKKISEKIIPAIKSPEEKNPKIISQKNPKPAHAKKLTDKVQEKIPAAEPPLKSSPADQDARIKKLEQELDEKETPTVKAKGGIQIIYGNVGQSSTELETPEEISELMKKIEVDYFKHRISEEDFRKAMYEYRTRLHLAEMRKEKGTGKKPEIEIIGSRKSQNEVEIPPNIAQQTYQQKYSAPAQPSIQKPAPMQQIQKPSLQQPIQKPSFSQSAASMPAPFIENQKTPAPQPTKTTSQVQQNPELASAIEAKFGGKISDQKIAELEEKINELLNKKAITKDQAISDIRGADSDRIVESFNKLISLIEMEHLAKQDAVQKRAIKSSTPIEPVQLKKQEIVEKGIEKQLQQQEITTSFDQILSIVKEKGRISSKDLAKSQNVPEKKVIELCKLLEDENLIVLNYLPVGGVIAQDINYLPPKGKTQKKEDENAKD